MIERKRGLGRLSTSETIPIEHPVEFELTEVSTAIPNSLGLPSGGDRVSGRLVIRALDNVVLHDGIYYLRTDAGETYRIKQILGEWHLLSPVS